VNDLVAPPGRSGLRARAAGLLRLAGKGGCAALELPLSRRGLALVFLAVALGLTLASWVRPPLSSDLRSLHVPLGFWENEPAPPEEILQGRRLWPDSVGLWLTVLILAGVGLLLWRPRLLGTVAGLVLCGALAANAAVALNHPALVELLDREYEQRQQLVSSVVELRENLLDNVLASTLTERIDTGLAANGQRADWGRGLAYLLHGRWLILWALLGVFLGLQGTPRRRLAGVLGWTLLGGALAALACSQRLGAEYFWSRAKHEESRGDPRAARAALETAVWLFPEFGRLERTWLLTGKLDHLQGRPTPQEQFFRAYQLARNKQGARAVAAAVDLPALTAGRLDYREGLAGSRDDSSALYRLARDQERRRALVLMDDLLAGGQRHPVVRHQAARLWTEAGLHDYLRPPIFAEAGLEFFHSNQRLLGAQDAWRRALRLAPERRDCSFYLSKTQARLDPNRPERIEAELVSLLRGLADRTLRAEVLALWGDACLAAGLFSEARQRYAESCQAFTLPEIINYRALKGLGGF
jgi:hypothetical protein